MISGACLKSPPAKTKGKPEATPKTASTPILRLASKFRVWKTFSTGAKLYKSLFHDSLAFNHILCYGVVPSGVLFAAFILQGFFIPTKQKKVVWRSRKVTLKKLWESRIEIRRFQNNHSGRPRSAQRCIGRHPGNNVPPSGIRFREVPSIPYQNVDLYRCYQGMEGTSSGSTP